LSAAEQEKKSAASSPLKKEGNFAGGVRKDGLGRKKSLPRSSAKKEVLARPGRRKEGGPKAGRTNKARKREGGLDSAS